MQNRFRSKLAWAAVAALLNFILGNYGLYDYIGLDSESFQTMFDLIAAVLVAFGIFNNPTSKEDY